MGRHRTRTDLGRHFGATDVVPERGEEGVAKVRDLTGGHGTRAVLEAVGHLPANEMAVGTVRLGGVISRVGVPPIPETPPSASAALRPQHHPHRQPRPVRAYIDRLLLAVLDGTVDPGLVFDRALPLDQAPEGYRAMDRRDALEGAAHSLTSGIIESDPRPAGNHGPRRASVTPPNSAQLRRSDAPLPTQNRAGQRQLHRHEDAAPPLPRLWRDVHSPTRSGASIRSHAPSTALCASGCRWA
ncbi:zinc-binding dehydrogenase [Streptomyces sp. NPDC056600]|uniref:zinc-binding dehydrogenase n=1 Tax=Streptomyces sp. NPDC056600 TaxID=3345874 RepID=UPI0036A6064E